MPFVSSVLRTVFLRADAASTLANVEHSLWTLIGVIENIKRATKVISKSLLTAIVASTVIGAMTAHAQDNVELNTIIDEHWQWYLEAYPESSREYGDASGNRLWNDVSPQALAARDEARESFITRLDALEQATLSEADQLNRKMLLTRLRNSREQHALGLDLMPINMRSGPQHRHAMVERLRLTSVADYEDWIARLEALPEQLKQYKALLSEGIESDRVQALAVMERVPGQLDKLLTENAESSPFWKPFAALPNTLTDEEMATLQHKAKAAIEELVTPAYAEFKEFMIGQYLPACRDQVGIHALKDGKKLYETVAQQFTTTDLTPEAIHELGKQEVARILREMEIVKTEVGFDGTLQEFNEFLRNDPQFYYETPEALLEAYQAVSKRLDPELVKLFGKLPRMPYGVRPIPAEIAPDTTTAYYMRPSVDGTRPGYYYVNLHNPSVRPKYEMEVLSVHEAVPGHHLQIALAMEMENVPNFRLSSNVTAFIEGWGLYSERLGYQMGLYQDPYSRYGQLIYDMWRAVRLVVDTGMHYFGWTRQEAIDYFLVHAAKTEADIVNEIDRYIGWPGQALAYKIGQLKILELRERAERELGTTFDIRAFHDHLLGAGAIPLDVLDERMTAWISSQTVKQ